MRRIAVGAALAWLVLAGPARAAGRNVTMHDRMFDPATVQIAVNDDVFWCNPSDEMHSVNADDGSFTRDFPAHSQCNGRTFQEAGTFPYHCRFHDGMRGTIIVGGGGGSAPPPPPPATTTTARPVTTTRAAAGVTTTTRRAVGTSTSRRAGTATTSGTLGPLTVLESTTTTAALTTTSGDIAIRQRDTGNSSSTAAALAATAAITLLGGAYLLYRMRATR